MIVHYDPTTSVVTHSVQVYPEGYVDFLKKDPSQRFVVFDKPVPHELAGVDKDGKGFVKGRMVLTHPQKVSLGQPAKVIGIPEGTAITFNGKSAGVMTADPALDLSLKTIGKFKIVFEHPRYVKEEITIEVIA